MDDIFFNQRKSELNRAARYAIRSGNYSSIKKYHAEILQLEKDFPTCGKVLKPEEWEHFHFLWKNMVTNEELNPPETS